jgi:hypothetical protein
MRPDFFRSLTGPLELALAPRFAGPRMFQRLSSGGTGCPLVLDILRFNIKGISKRDFVQQRIVFLQQSACFFFVSHIDLQLLRTHDILRHG